MRPEDWFALCWCYGWLACLGGVMLLIFAWEDAGDLMPKWWTDRHSAVISLFWPVTFVLAPWFWLAVGMRALASLVRRLGLLAFDVPR